MQCTDLGGHSGCRILLCETEDNVTFVRKISGSIGYNERLQIQAEKQSNFKSRVIKTPKVLRQGKTKDGLFFFDMEYISGTTLSEYIKTIEIGRVRNLVQAIVSGVVDIENGTGCVDEDVFKNKIVSLRKKLCNQHNIVIEKSLDILETHSWSKYTVSRCHGDLTLENIIVKNNQLYLIDFLDSFYDCWILDISTLLQDVHTLWSYRFEDEININTLIRLIVFRDILIDTIREAAPESYSEVYYALLLKLIRIIPYTKDDRTYSFLIDKMATILRIIEQGITV